jgi:hypothetical protein
MEEYNDIFSDLDSPPVAYVVNEVFKNIITPESSIRGEMYLIDVDITSEVKNLLLDLKDVYLTTHIINKIILDYFQDYTNHNLENLDRINCCVFKDRFIEIVNKLHNYNIKNRNEFPKEINYIIEIVKESLKSILPDNCEYFYLLDLKTENKVNKNLDIHYIGDVFIREVENKDTENVFLLCLEVKRYFFKG